MFIWAAYSDQAQDKESRASDRQEPWVTFASWLMLLMIWLRVACILGMLKAGNKNWRHPCRSIGRARSVELLHMLPAFRTGSQILLIRSLEARFCQGACRRIMWWIRSTSWHCPPKLPTIFGSLVNLLRSWAHHFKCFFPWFQSNTHAFLYCMSTSTWLAWCRLESKFGTTSLPRTPSCRDILQQYEYSSVLQEVSDIWFFAF